jgi:hypothetical protein
VIAHPEGGAGSGELPGAVTAELVAAVGRELGELVGDHLALLPEGAGDERDGRIGLGRVARDGAARGQRLVVRVGVHQEQPPPGRGWHHVRTVTIAADSLWRAATQPICDLKEVSGNDANSYCPAPTSPGTAAGAPSAPPL